MRALLPMHSRNDVFPVRLDSPSVLVPNVTVMPGTEDEPSGWLGTMVLGIVGAIIGGWVWGLVLNQPGASGVNIGSILVAFVGSCIVIGVMRLFTHGRTTSY